MQASFSPSHTWGMKPDTTLLNEESLKWDLRTLYTLWDKIEHARGQLTSQFMHFTTGTSLEVIDAWFESVNRRFSCSDVRNGVRLDALTSRADRIPVFDRKGVQVCLGDKLKAQVCTGRYGQTALVDAEATELHLVYGQISAMQGDLPRTIALNGYLVRNADVGYLLHNDFEHGYEQWLEVQL